MVTRNENGLVRVTLTLDPVDVELLDALARFEGQNRSSEVRGLLAQVRPTMQQLVATFSAAEAQRESLDAAMLAATVSELQGVLPEAEELQRRMMGMLAKLEGQAAAAAGPDPDAPASNTGATT
jgi:hypothetical protein